MLKAFFSSGGIEFHALTVITLSGWTVVFGAMGLFFVSSRRELPEWRSAGFVLCVAASSMTAGVFTILVFNQTIFPTAVFIWKSSFDIYAALIFLYGARVYLEANRRFSELRSSLMSLTLSTITVSYVANVVLHEIPIFTAGPLLPGVNIEMVLDVVRIATLLAICVALITDLNYMYRVPIEFYGVFAILGSGVCIFSHSEQDGSADPNLFSSALVAIGSVLKEGTRSQGHLVRVSTADREILIESRPEYDLIVAAILERSSLFLRRSTQMFADMFCSRFGEELKKEPSRIDVFNEAEDLVEIAFPYLHR